VTGVNDMDLDFVSSLLFSLFLLCVLPVLPMYIYMDENVCSGQPGKVVE
jgi:hypothetical protein